MKKIIIAVIITAILSGIFILIRRTEKNTIHKGKIILNEHQIEPYINIKGWKVTEIDCGKIKIPKKFTGSYIAFADEMKRFGFDLDKHKGESVNRYTYSVDNYGESGAIAELLITDDNELISAALIQQKSNGFIKPL